MTFLGQLISSAASEINSADNSDQLTNAEINCLGNSILLTAQEINCLYVSINRQHPK